MKIFISHSRNNQEQLRLEGLVRMLKRSKGSSLKSSDLLHVHELSHLLLEYERKQYLNKKNKYKIHLHRCEQQLRYPSLFDYCFIDPAITSTYQFNSEAAKQKLEKRKEILVEAIRTIDEFIATNDESLKFSIKQIESELLLYIDPFEYLCDPLEATYRVYETSTNPKKFILKRLKVSIRKIVIKISRDLRFSFRSIVRFLFKNMDDNSGDENVLRFHLCKALFLHFKIIYPNGFKRNNTRYQQT